MKEEEELIHTLKKSQAEPKISMNVGCWKVGDQHVTEEETPGKFGVAGERNDNWERFNSFCALSNLAIVSTMFPHIRSSLNG